MTTIQFKKYVKSLTIYVIDKLKHRNKSGT